MGNIDQESYEYKFAVEFLKEPNKENARTLERYCNNMGFKAEKCFQYIKEMTDDSDELSVLVANKVRLILNCGADYYDLIVKNPNGSLREYDEERLDGRKAYSVKICKVFQEIGFCKKPENVDERVFCNNISYFHSTLFQVMCGVVFRIVRFICDKGDPKTNDDVVALLQNVITEKYFSNDAEYCYKVYVNTPFI